MIRYLKVFLLLVSYLITSCASSDKVLRPAQDDNGHLSGVTPHVRNPDSLHTPAPRRLLGLLPAKKPKPTAAGYTFGKKSTVNITLQNGNNNTAASANATKPGTMATGPEATAVDASKVKAPVQTGAGNEATDNSKAGQRGGAAATGAGSSASNETRKGGTPWVVWAAVALGGAAAGWWVRGKVSMWSWWPSWARPG